MNEKLAKAFGSAFSLSPQQFSDTLTPESVPGWDSLGHLRLVTAIQEEFQLEFEIDEIMTMDSVTNIKQILGNRGIAA